MSNTPPKPTKPLDTSLELAVSAQRAVAELRIAAEILRINEPTPTVEKLRQSMHQVAERLEQAIEDFNQADLGRSMDC